MKPQNLAIRRFLGMQLAQESYSLVEQSAQPSTYFSRLVSRENPQSREQIEQENAIATSCSSVESSGFEITCI